MAYKTIIYRYLVRQFSPSDTNLRAEMLGGEKSDQHHDPIITSRHDSDHDSKHIITLDVNEADKENGVLVSYSTLKIFRPTGGWSAFCSSVQKLSSL